MIRWKSLKFATASVSQPSPAAQPENNANSDSDRLDSQVPQGRASVTVAGTGGALRPPSQSEGKDPPSAPDLSGWLNADILSDTDDAETFEIVPLEASSHQVSFTNSMKNRGRMIPTISTWSIRRRPP